MVFRFADEMCIRDSFLDATPKRPPKSSPNTPSTAAGLIIANQSISQPPYQRDTRPEKPRNAMAIRPADTSAMRCV